MRRRSQSPISRLYLVLVYAAQNMRSSGARANAAARAALIPRTRDERYNMKSAEAVRRARTFLRNLPDYGDDMLDVAALQAQEFANIVHAAMYQPRMAGKSELSDGDEEAA